jgi:hypothetical protein
MEQKPTTTQAEGEQLDAVTPGVDDCTNCKWYYVNTVTCHRYPPTAKGWQHAKPGNWCGEWVHNNQV